MDWRMDMFLKLIIVFSGEGWLHLETESLPLRGSTLCVVPCGCRHRLEDVPETPMSIYLICLDLEIISFREIIEKLVKKLHRRPINTRPGIGDTIVRQILYEQTTQREGYRELITGLIETFLVQLLRDADVEASTRTSRERVRAYVLRTAQNFYAQQSLDEAAQLCGLSRRRFCQLFREHVGESWNAWIIGLRIGHACRLLKGSDRSIQSVAFECGFNDLAHFYRTFQMRVKVTPLKFRQNRE